MQPSVERVVLQRHYGLSAQPACGHYRQTVLDEAQRLQSANPPGSQCYLLGQYMQQNISSYRTTPFDFTDPATGKSAGGDSHKTEPAPGAGTMHIAVGYNSLNPWKGWPAELELYRHEAAHLAFNLGQSDAMGNDPAELVAQQCGPAGS